MTVPRPKVITSLKPVPGRYRKHVDAATEPDWAQDIPAVPGGRVILSVAYGLRPADAGELLRVAARLRPAAVVEILGRTPKAVAQAKATLAAAWDMGDLLTVGGRDA